jgi:exopolysaccharide biosynthesis protein
MVIHVVTVDLREPGVSLLVTPGDPKEELPLTARTTSKFLDEFGVQIAVNGDGFSPWHSNGIFDYYPHTGDPVEPTGFAASQGTVYSPDTDAEPTLYISRTGQARFNSPGSKAYNAISGNLMLIEKGLAVVAQAAGQQNEKPKDEKVRNRPVMDEPSNGQDVPQPRTALAVDKSGRRLLLVVVDGRQPNYSEGTTLAELAEILLAHGGYTGMNLDGGGSTTLVMEGSGGRPVLLNSPVHQRIPGRERPVGNHLGVKAPGD